MIKKYLLPVLVILFVPVFLLLIKMTSEIMKYLFDANNSDSIAASTFIMIIAVIAAVGIHVLINDQIKEEIHKKKIEKLSKNIWGDKQ